MASGDAWLVLPAGGTETGAGGEGVGWVPINCFFFDLGLLWFFSNKWGLMGLFFDLGLL